MALVVVAHYHRDGQPVGDVQPGKNLHTDVQVGRGLLDGIEVGEIGQITQLHFLETLAGTDEPLGVTDIPVALAVEAAHVIDL